MCKAAGKKWSHYYSNLSTQEFIKELARSTGIPAVQLVQSLSGGKEAMDSLLVKCLNQSVC
jgi:hypothetical protein